MVDWAQYQLTSTALPELQLPVNLGVGDMRPAEVYKTEGEGGIVMKLIARRSERVTMAT